MNWTHRPLKKKPAPPTAAVRMFELAEKMEGQPMSVNCVNCGRRERTAFDLLCDECRHGRADLTAIAAQVESLAMDCRWFRERYHTLLATLRQPRNRDSLAHDAGRVAIFAHIEELWEELEKRRGD